MPYALPTFNLPCAIRTAGAVVGPPRVTVLGNLNRGLRIAFSPGIPGDVTDPTAYMYLLVPKSTDLRGVTSSTGADSAEVPAGSGRFYSVLFVDDVGKGFPNEHRFGLLMQLFSPNWPTPDP